MTTKKKTMNETEILAVLTATPLSGFIEALRTGEFQPCSNNPVAQDETVVGELTGIEKALRSAAWLLEERAEKIVATNNSMVDEAEKENEKIDEWQVFLNKCEFEATEKFGEGFTEYMWYCINKRIGAPIEGSGGLGIRDGFKLASLPLSRECAECNSVVDFIRQLFGRRR